MKERCWANIYQVVALEVEGSIPFAHPINAKDDATHRPFCVYAVRKGVNLHVSKRTRREQWIDRS